ncbi:unnamed protein product, partial [Mesorhabditis belari]|uniref:AN1-type domain-containing protein n=1 Tax=Mesorhabditis belari TaxID=2138241 RepID=A0AAF3FD08_9BILA
MAEFPSLGQHCGVDLCNQLDFLPVKCDACHGTFCITHFTYDGHECKETHSKNVQVPVCPLCNQPVPVGKGANIDQIVNQHIDMNCPTKQKKRIFKNQCSKVGCKKRELVPFTCNRCSKNFCVSHRHESDHDCEKNGPATSRAGLAAVNRNAQSCSRQAQVSEDEALARALASSLNTQTSPEEMDRRIENKDVLEPVPVTKRTRIIDIIVITAFLS